MANPGSHEEKRGKSPARVGNDEAIETVRQALNDLRYGTVTIVVQDGVVVQVERTEKKRL